MFHWSLSGRNLELVVCSSVGCQGCLILLDGLRLNWHGYALVPVLTVTCLVNLPNG